MCVPLRSAQSFPARDGCVSSGNALQALPVAHAEAQALKPSRQPVRQEMVPLPTLSGREVAVE